MHRRNVFAGPYLDRVAHLRDDPDWFANALDDVRSRVVPVWNSRSLIAAGESARAATLPLEAVPAEQRGQSDLILLGRVGEISFFAWGIDALEAPQLSGARFEDLRLIASLLPADDAGLLGYARAMVSWRYRHRFCGICGATTLPTKGGHVLVCTNPTCRHQQFPRLDPAIIVLVSDGDRALLGRQATWPQGRYSTIAGFVEPGESLEDAVVREVLEETGVVVGAVEYHSSQPWPFPASLMLGFLAGAESSAIHRWDQELEDARWFSRDELVAGGATLLPPTQSISFSLIETWFDARSAHPLREIHSRTTWP